MAGRTGPARPSALGRTPFATLILAVRLAVLRPWLHVPGAGPLVGGLGQTAALALLVAALAVVGGRDPARR
ncbi:hypothetical protein ACF1AB_04475 [Streptomyces sp. NPDC014846]|uniref:hypothetical protein n=1 Tax=unclassified Streptomyces TaxID=2593676 RepID=UPI0036F6FB0D